MMTTWESFYVIVGSSAAALTGLMFVVMALVSDIHAPRTSGSVAAFGTPNIVHFCFVLTVAGALTAPWPSPSSTAYAIALIGAAGVVYTLIVIRRAIRLTEYRAVFEDWLWHAVFPFLAYAAIIVGGLLLPSGLAWPAFLIGAASLLLLFAGIHNAWDTVTYVTVSRWEHKHAAAEPAATERVPSV